MAQDFLGVVRRWKTKALGAEHAATVEHRCLARKTQYLETGLLLADASHALANVDLPKVHSARPMPMR